MNLGQEVAVVAEAKVLHLMFVRGSTVYPSQVSCASISARADLASGASPPRLVFALRTSQLAKGEDCNGP